MKKLKNKIQLCLDDEMLERVQHFSKKHYFSSIQDYIRMCILINTAVDIEKESKD